MSKPTEEAWVELKHLVQFLLGCTEHGFLSHVRSDFDTQFLILQVYTDSDWAANTGTRKSVSACEQLSYSFWKSKSRLDCFELCGSRNLRSNLRILRWTFPLQVPSVSLDHECCVL